MKKFQISITGMGCAHCVQSVTQVLRNIGATVNSCEIGQANIFFSGSVDVITEAVESLGFTVKTVMEA
ncbi:MAG: heavy-metal-associated domain-containing protein [Clostridia bacterium]